MSVPIKYLDTVIAGKRADVTRQTVVNWCHKYREGHEGLGILRAGRWKVDPQRLQLLIEGKAEELWCEIKKVRNEKKIT